MERIRHVIDGVEVSSVDGDSFAVIDPATGEQYAEAAFGKAVDVDAAVASAKTAFEEGRWSSLPSSERAATLRRCAELVVERSDAIGATESRDSGKPLQQACEEVREMAGLFHYYAGLLEEPLGTVYSQPEGYFTFSERVPYGVVGALAPWNYPFQLAVAKVVPALAAGNTVVLKMAEQTPASTSVLALLALEAGVPPGVFNVVHGDGETTGAALAAHPDVPKLTFTGSTETGRRIMRAAAEHIKSVHLELGGKTANIVLDDADLEQAVAGTLFTSFANTGQICTSGSRLLLQESIADEFLDRLLHGLDRLRVGDPSDPRTVLGPLISREQYDRVQAYIRLGEEAGARRLTPHPASLPGSGYFVPPTVFDQVDPSMRIAQEEIFGPVLSVLRFTDLEDAIRIANGVVYGLAATVWTNDLRRSFTLSKQLQAGIVWTNCPHFMTWNVPYEGHRLSGLGEDQGKEALREFTQLKVNYIAHAGQVSTWP